jgi:adenosine/AMP kinase
VYDKGSGADVIRWTNEKPMNVLRNLKRGNEWYRIRKGTSTPLNKVVQEEHLEQLTFGDVWAGLMLRMYIILHFD